MPFKITHKDLLLPMLASFRLTWPLWCCMAAGLVLLVVGTVWDARLAVLGLMVWLTVAPMVAFLLYFSKALSPSVVPNLIPHTVRRVSDGYRMSLFRPAEKEDDEEDSPRWELTSELTVYDRDLVREQTLGAFRVLYFSAKPLSVLYLPLRPHLIRNVNAGVTEDAQILP